MMRNQRNREFLEVTARVIQDGRSLGRMLGYLSTSSAIMRPSYKRRHTMSWTCPEITEICVGMEITSYEAAEV